jgi:hypothetical protein
MPRKPRNPKRINKLAATITTTNQTIPPDISFIVPISNTKLEAKLAVSLPKEEADTDLA